MTAPARPRRPAPGVVPAGPRLEARARAERSGRRRRWARRLLRATAVVVPLAVLAWVVLLSPLLAVDRVQVAGAGRLTAEQVVEAAAVPSGTPLARVDDERVGDRVRSLAPVASVRVRRVWPGTLRVEVTERVARVAVARPDGALLLDAEGVAFGTDPAPPPGLPLLEIGEPEAGGPATRAALAVLLDLPPELAGQVAVLRASTPSDVSFQLADGRTVVWGPPGGTATKTAALRALLGKPGSRFDVSSPGVAVRS